MQDCIFCKIINKKMSSDIIYEDDMVIAFKDIHPVAPVHVLIVPKVHIANVNLIDGKNICYITKIWSVAKEIAKLCNVDKTGYRIICNTLEDGGQVVDHIHFHLIGGKRLGPKIIRE